MGSGVVVPALLGADCQGCCSAIRGGMVSWHVGSNVWCRVNSDHGVAHGLVEGVVALWAQIIRKCEGVKGSFDD